MKRLLLLRHAKTEQANKDTPADSERELTARGREDAAAAGQAMRLKGYEADLILCSPARRTRQTLELANNEWHSSAQIEIAPSIYAGSAQRLLTLFQGLPESASSVLAVGHNPGFEDSLALLLESNGIPAHVSGPAGERFPTAVLAVLDFDITRWSDLRPHVGRLVDFIRP